MKKSLSVAIAGSLALACGLSVAPAAPAGANGPTAPAVAGKPGLLEDLILDDIGRMDRTFDPQRTSYSATAYRSRDSVSVYPVAADPGESVLVNGATPDATGRVTVPLEVGKNTVRVELTSGEHTKRYTLTVTKLDTDFRGRERVDGVSASSPVGSSDGHSTDFLVDGDTSTTWAPPFPFTAGPADADGVTQFVLDLHEVRQVSKVTGTVRTFKDQWFPSPGANYAQIDVSPDGETWTTVADRAPLRGDQGLLYWDWNHAADARYVRVTLAAASAKLLQWLEWEDFEVFATPQSAKPAKPAKPGKVEQIGVVPDGAEGVNRAQELAMAYNIMVGAWLPVEGQAGSTPDAAEYTSLGSPFAQFYDPPLSNLEFMTNNPNATWGIAKAPFGNNAIGSSGEPRAYIPDTMEPYVGNYIDAQYGDEGGYSRSEVDAFAQWFDFSKQEYPQAVAHSNQNSNPAWSNLENFRHYVRTAQPDLASFDHYYWGGGGVFGSHGPREPWQVTSQLLGLEVWKTQRQAALEGLTGDGSQPIMFGQYLDAFDSNSSQSQREIVTSLSLATGMKWLSLFRLEYMRFDGGAMVDRDGAPLREWYEFADQFAMVKNYGKYLTLLNNEWVSTAAGTHVSAGGEVANPVASGWHMSAFDDAPNAEYGVLDVAATNTGSTNDGLPGDVVMGYFSALPGLDKGIVEDTFDGTDPRAFMVVNGLTSMAELPSYGQGIRYDDGQFWQTAQDITITVAPPTAGSTLMQVDPDTGKSSRVKLSRDRATGAYTTTANLGGGQAALYYWTDAPTTWTATVAGESVAQGDSTALELTVSNNGRKAISEVTVAPQVPEGWSVTPASRSIGSVPAGESASAEFTLTNDGVTGISLLPLQVKAKNIKPFIVQASATGTCGTPTQPTAVAVSSQETDREPTGMQNAVDGDPSTFWNRRWSTDATSFPHWIVLDAGKSTSICELSYLPRQNATAGRVKTYEIYVSDDPDSFPQTPAKTGTLVDTGEWQTIPLDAQGRYVKLVGLDAQDGRPAMSAAELTLTVR